MAVPENFTQESRDRWARSAPGWRAHAAALSQATMPVSVWMIDALDLQPGHDVLELAAGTGDTGFLAAELIAPGGTLISSDFVGEMLTGAQQRALQLRLENVRFRQIDATSIDQPAASLDGVLCRWGYMLMGDAEAALRETRRILRPGGRVALAAWTSPQENPWASTPMRELVRRGISPAPDPDAPGQFAWAPDGRIAENLDAAGFSEHRIEAVDFAMRHPSLEAWIDRNRALGLAFREALDGLDPETHADVLRALAEQALPYAGADGGLTLPARTWVAVATA